ncbi:MAG TPA: pentapeptide repeat-containing protein [Ktedonosporobacter sp.]|nr:pentapeptide repeat-containing protein [Ktedonosporobacter sp.]
MAWNEWKANQPRTDLLDLSETDFAEVNVHLDGIDLTFCNLQGCNLSSFQATQAHFDSADLQGANLSRTNLRSAHIFGADLSHALLAGAILTGANLSGADLSQADLSCAGLNGANLTGADLSRTDFLQASLKGADFSSCLFGGLTVFGQVDLSEARGLGRIKHDGTVILDILSIYMSGGNIPGPLLRAASLPESFLTLIPTLDFEEEEGDATAP